MRWKVKVTSPLLVVVVILVLHARLTQAVPSITAFTQPITIHEDVEIETRLRQVVCTNAGDTCICNSSPTDITSTPFTVWKKATDTAFYVYFLGDSNTNGLDFATTQTYTLTITCVDSAGANSDTITAEIDVIQNQEPQFTNAEYKDHTLSLDATTPYPADTLLYTFTADDEEDDPLTFSITTSPSVNYFTVGSANGELRTAVDLRTATVDRIYLTASVTDQRSTINDFIIDITITNPNSAPVFSTLPDTAYVGEDTAGGSLVHQLTLTDSDTFGNPLVPECIVSPTAEQYKFEYTSGTQKLSLASLTGGALPLDFETTSTYSVVCTVSDGYLTSTGTLTISVVNVNEPPVFDEIYYDCALEEGAVASSSCSLNAVITDPESDTIASVTFLSGNNSERFRYDESLSTVSLAVDYDVDTPVSYATSVTLQLQATDVFGASSSVPVYITVSDINDKTCEVNSLASFTIDQSTSTGLLGTLVATDDDLTFPFNDVTFSVTGTSPASAANYITIFTDGQIYYTNLIPTSEHGNSFIVSVQCQDGGTPPLTAPGSVVLSYSTTTTTSTTSTTTTTTTTTTTSDSSDDPFDDEAFVAVFVVLMALLFLLLLIALYFCLKACGWCGGQGGSWKGMKDFCMPRKEKQVRPKDDYFNYNTRTNNEYRDSYWNTADKYEQGDGFNAKGEVIGTNTGRPRLNDPLRTF